MITVIIMIIKPTLNTQSDSKLYFTFQHIKFGILIIDYFYLLVRCNETIMH